MKIQIKPQSGQVTFDQIKYGDLFIFHYDGKDRVYMKVNNDMAQDRAVRMEDEYICVFREITFVTPIIQNTPFVIEM